MGEQNLYEVGYYFSVVNVIKAYIRQCLLLIKHFWTRYLNFYMVNKSLGSCALFVLILLFTFSCTTVKEYQKAKLNDSEMILGNRKVEKTELSFQSYREGASGANSGKSGGGCGCN